MNYVDCLNCNGTGQVRYLTGSENLCRHCNSQISPRALSCAYCGEPNYKGQGDYTLDHYGPPEACNVCSGSGQMTEAEAADMKSDKTGCLGAIIMMIPGMMLGMVTGWNMTGEGFWAGLEGLSYGLFGGMIVAFILARIVAKVDDPIKRLALQKRFNWGAWFLVVLMLFFGFASC